MGDRANIYAKEREDQGVYFYTHWTGYRLPETLREALERGRSRWGDEAYLNRRIFDTLTEGKQGEETGYGISAFRQDNEHYILVVDHGAQEVHLAKEGNERSGPYRKTWTFKEYVLLGSPVTWFSLVGQEEDEEE